jgi:hypothetical protein
MSRATRGVLEAELYKPGKICIQRFQIYILEPLHVKMPFVIGGFISTMNRRYRPKLEPLHQAYVLLKATHLSTPPKANASHFWVALLYAQILKCIISALPDCH